MIHLQRLKQSSIVFILILFVGLLIYTLILHNNFKQEKNSNVALEEQIKSTQEQLSSTQKQIQEYTNQLVDLQNKINLKKEYTVNLRKLRTRFEKDGENKILEDIWCPWVSVENVELEKQINELLENCFNDWMLDYSGYFNASDTSEISITLSSKQYLSIMMHYMKVENGNDLFYVANTINMQTGEWVALDDIVEVDEELVSLLLTEGIPKIDYSVVSGEYNAALSRDILANLDSEDILKELKACNQEYTQTTTWSTDGSWWRTKGNFWLTEDRLYLYNVLFIDSEIYVEYEDIAHKIKDKSLLGGE